MSTFVKISALFLTVLLSTAAFNSMIAQFTSDDVRLRLVIAELAFLEIEPNNNLITFSLTQPTEAGLPTQAGTNNEKWINYTSCVSSNGVDRSVTVQINSGSVPPGLQLSLSVSSYTGSGAGITGTPAGPVVLSSIAQTLLSGIRGSYTGIGANNGHQLTYNLSIANYSLLDYDQSSSIQVIYTIVE